MENAFFSRPKEYTYVDFLPLLLPHKFHFYRPFNSYVNKMNVIFSCVYEKPKRCYKLQGHCYSSRRKAFKCSNIAV